MLDMKESFAERLNKLMVSKNMSLTKLSSKSGLSKSSISEYLSGTYEAKQKSIYYLAKALEVDPAVLLGIGEIEIDPKLKKIPILNAIKANERGFLNENIEREEVVDDQRITFAIRVPDNSLMNARIMSGDIAYVSQSAAVENGNIIVLQIQGESEAKIRRYSRYGNKIILRHDYPTASEVEYGPREIKILGKIVKVLFYLGD